MSQTPVFAFAIFLLSVLTGCVGKPKDITDSSTIQSLAIVGRCLLLKQEVPLCRLGRPFPRLIIRGCPAIAAQGGPGEHVADLRRGTRLRIAKVVDAVSYNDGFFQRRRRHVFARIESGPESGSLVDLGWRQGLSIEEISPDLYARCPDEP